VKCVCGCSKSAHRPVGVSWQTLRGECMECRCLEYVDTDRDLRQRPDREEAKMLRDARLLAKDAKILGGEE